MFRGFHPTQAVEADNARRRRYIGRYPVTSRAQISTNWREATPIEIKAMPQFTFPRNIAPRSSLTVSDLLLRKAAGMSLHYRGDPTVASNRSAPITNAENTSLWVMGLPREWANYYNVMELLKGRGKILAVNISEAKSQYLTAAATITFFRHVDAENVMKAMNDGTLRVPYDGAESQDSSAVIDKSSVSSDSSIDDGCLSPYHSDEPTLIDLDFDDSSSSSTISSITTASTVSLPGAQLIARWNRVRVAEMKLRGGKRPVSGSGGPAQLPSRVVHVCGRLADVSPNSLETYFSTKFRYNLDRIIYLGIRENGMAEYEYRFACWKNQAEFAAMALRREKPEIKCWYGVDPCEVEEAKEKEKEKEDNILDEKYPVMQVKVSDFIS